MVVLFGFEGDVEIELCEVVGDWCEFGCVVMGGVIW